MLTPADIRADLGLITTAHDDLIALAIMGRQFMGIGVPEAVIRYRVCLDVMVYPEIDAALIQQKRQAA